VSENANLFEVFQTRVTSAKPELRKVECNTKEMLAFLWSRGEEERN